MLTPTPFFTRRKALALLGGGVLCGPAGCAYMRYVEPTWIKTVHRRVSLAAPGAFTLLHLSDLHASPVVSYAYLERVIDAAVALAPDVIAITGDFITRRIDGKAPYAALLARLAAAAPTFAVAGNHDGGRWVEPHGGYASLTPLRTLLDRAGIPLLHNRHHDLDLPGARIRLVGVGDLWSDDCHPHHAFPPDRTDRTTVVLNHNPDAKEQLLAHPWDLMLCGHTHGGQLCLPLVGTPFAPVRDHRFVHGLYRWESRWLHVTSGVGSLRGLRLNCRPELCLLHCAG